MNRKKRAPSPPKTVYTSYLVHQINAPPPMPAKKGRAPPPPMPPKTTVFDPPPPPPPKFKSSPASSGHSSPSGGTRSASSSGNSTPSVPDSGVNSDHDLSSPPPPEDSDVSQDSLDEIRLLEEESPYQMFATSLRKEIEPIRRGQDLIRPLHIQCQEEIFAPPPPEFCDDSPLLMQVNESPAPPSLTHLELIRAARDTIQKKKKKKKRTKSVRREHDDSFDFHMNEGDAPTADDEKAVIEEFAFAGIRMVTPVPPESTGTIRSHRGTVRGVRNRVRAGIATFLQDPSSKVSNDFMH